MVPNGAKRYILINISRSKANQTKKFGQLIEYRLRNIFVKSHTQHVVEKLFTYPFLKNQNRTYLLNFMQFVFNVCKVEDYIEAELQTT